MLYFFSCPHGSYGAHCQKSCLLSKTKYIEILACKNGWYGPGCKTPCGHCFGSEVCHHINGSCPGNCTDGYSGETCSNSMFYFLWLKHHIDFKNMLFKFKFIYQKRKITTLLNNYALFGIEFFRSYPDPE